MLKLFSGNTGMDNSAKGNVDAGEAGVKGSRQHWSACL